MGGERDEGEEEVVDGEEPSSPSVKKAAEAEGVTTLHEVRAKLYMQEVGSGASGWKDRGAGNITIKQHSGVAGGPDGGSGKTRLSVLFRNEVGKVVVNAPIVSKLKAIQKKNTVSAVLVSIQDDTANAAVPVGGEKADGGEPKAGPRFYMFRLGSEENAKALQAAFEDAAQRAA